jgi:hypothetical protein
MHHIHPLPAGEDASSLVTTSATAPRSATATATESTTVAKATPGATATAERTTTAASVTESTTASGRTTTSRGATSARTTGTTSTSRLLDLGRTGVGLGLGQELLEGKELVAANVNLVTSLEAGSMDAITRLDGEVDLVQRAENFIDLADLRLVLEENRGIEVGDFGVDGGADHLAFGSVHKGAHL